jgi:EpsI family protein
VNTTTMTAADGKVGPLPGEPERMRRALVLGGLMAATSGAAVVGMPKLQVTSESQMPDLERMIPERFGRWDLDRNTVPLALSPDVAQMLNTIYDRTLARTFVSPQGERIMLSIAYGANQSRALQLHKPEVCYSAQGFRIGDLRKADWNFGVVGIPTMHLIGVLGQRVEPVTYWMRIGDEIARGWYEQNVARLRYGARGLIPDGVLFRLSNISRDPIQAFEIQKRFMGELLPVLTPDAQRMFIGAASLRRGVAAG